MTSFANPAADAQSGAATYIANLITILGDRDPLAVMEEQPAVIAGIGADLSDTVLRRPEAPGKWSMVEVVQHLADTEIVYGYRVRTTLATPGAPIQAYDENVWARELHYGESSFTDAMDQLRALRRANLRLLRSLSEEELDRFGLHSERGRESVSQVIKLTAGHDLVHRRQLERIKNAVLR